MKDITKKIKLVLPAIIVGMIIGWLFFHDSGSEKQQVHEHAEHTEQETTWTCSMHPQIKQDKPGDCPICGMDLVPMASLRSSDGQVSPNEIQMSESAVQLANIQTTTVTKGIPQKSISLLGKVKPDERNIAELTARFGGRIEKLFVNYTGQEVYKGQKLATIYSPELITAQKELIEAVQFIETNPTYYKAAVSKLKLWDLSDEQIEGIIENSEPQLYFNILSPITGTVTQRHVALGDYIREGDGLFKVIDLSRVWVMFEAYESDLPWIKKGDHIEFTIQSLPGKSYEGSVTYIDPFIDPSTRIAQVRVELRNREQELKPEMFANGVLHSQIAKNTNKLLIPKSAILWTGKRAVVYVKVPDRETPSFKFRQITLGPEAGDFYVVSEGLTEGEEIATNGVFKIDAAAQLAGKPSMMNPPSSKASGGKTVGGKTSTGHDHGSLNMDYTEEHSEHSMSDVNIKHESSSVALSGNRNKTLSEKTFKVSGNCEMCKNTIEKAAKSLPGVNSAHWDIESKMLHATYNSQKNKLSDIHKAIAKSGYDTEKETALKEAYDNLPPCCQYTRASRETTESNVKNILFKVSGNCGMCKTRIEEAALSLDGVKYANWDEETKMMEVAFDSTKTDVHEVQLAITNVGHDTEMYKAKDEVYNKLPGCCKYTRDSE